MRPLIAALVTLSAVRLFAGSVEGKVTIGETPAPGCTVTIRRDFVPDRSATTDEDGSYAFRDLPPGNYTLSFELSTFDPVEKEITIGSDRTLVSTPMTVSSVGPIHGCSACSEEAPKTQWDLASCADYRADSELMEDAERNDRTALALLQERYRTTLSWSERIRIAGALLGRIANDDAIWKELATPAEQLVRLDEAQFDACAIEHGYEPAEYRSIAWSSFDQASRDLRARPMLRRALQSSEIGLLMESIAALAAQHDDAALPQIADVLARAEAPADLAPLLADYGTQAADQLAMRYMTDAGDRERNRESQVLNAPR
jgi:carboxypeptidase family protein